MIAFKAQEAHLRHSSYYATRLSQHDLAARRGPNSVAAVISAFQADWLQIKAGQAWAAANRLNQQTSITLARDYASAAISMFVRLKKPLEVILWLGALVPTQPTDGDAYAAWSQLHASYSVRLTGFDDVAAREYLENLSRLLDEIDDEYVKALTLAALATLDVEPLRTTTFPWDYARSIQRTQQALRASRACGNWPLTAELLLLLASSYALLDAHHTAIRYLEEEIAIAQRESHSRLQKHGLEMLMSIYLHAIEPTKAVRAAQTARAIAIDPDPSDWDIPSLTGDLDDDILLMSLRFAAGLLVEGNLFLSQELGFPPHLDAFCADNPSEVRRSLSTEYGIPFDRRDLDGTIALRLLRRVMYVTTEEGTHPRWPTLLLALARSGWRGIRLLPKIDEP